MNPWESCALESRYPENASGTVNRAGWTHDAAANANPLIYPGLYCPSGFDIMNILIRVATRLNPKIELGAIDSSVALTLCDLHRPDCPIVYASESFYILTGYGPSEVIGQNCRFLQAPGGNVKPGSTRKDVDKDVVRKMRKSIERNSEVQLEVTNFRKNGQRFTNMLTMIPVMWDSQDFRYSVGFQCDRDAS